MQKVARQTEELSQGNEDSLRPANDIDSDAT
jgi:hypothetical protein